MERRILELPCTLATEKMRSYLIANRPAYHSKNYKICEANDIFAISLTNLLQLTHDITAPSEKYFKTRNWPNKILTALYTIRSYRKKTLPQGSSITSLSEFHFMDWYSGAAK